MPGSARFNNLPYSRAWLMERLRLKASPRPDENFPPYAHSAELEPVPAAVLVPIVNQPDGLTLMFTQRTAHLYDHAGQISFPGGRVDAADADRIATALREAQEETGLCASRVQVIGQLPDYDIPTGFRVTPVVGWVEPPFELKPDAFEVADVFEVPLEFFLDPANHRRHSDIRNGRTRYYYSMPYGERNIWGATAGMVYSLYQLLTADIGK
ncbi:MAG TPA: CoA pyrophosphatase [Burkholderiales bacterium]|nr:CoA pyrophosphatase [Burkholderiales bacterium]